MNSLMVTCVVLSALLLTCYTKRDRYIATERPSVIWYDPAYMKDVTITARRYGRSDPQHYVAFNFVSLYEFHNNVTLSFYFFEYLSNFYKRSFVEMHYRFCDMLQKGMFFGPGLRNAFQNRSCPFPAGVYNLTNISVPAYMIPDSFPFLKGRIFLNISSTEKETVHGMGQIDMEIKNFLKHKRKIN